MRSMTGPLMGAVLIVVVGSGCGADGEEPSSRPGDPGSTSSSATIHAVPEDQADLTLVISNQSFEDDMVRIDVAVDGVQVVDQDFAVEGHPVFS